LLKNAQQVIFARHQILLDSQTQLELIVQSATIVLKVKYKQCHVLLKLQAFHPERDK
jgi:hypothetical protein